MTDDDVRARLGLEPFDEFWQRTGRGRTVRMLCEAVAAADGGRRVRIVGHSVTYTRDLVRRAREIAEACGVTPALILEAPRRLELADVGANYSDLPMLFRDHYDPI